MTGGGLVIVALADDPVRRLLPLDLLKPRNAPVHVLCDPEREGGRVVLLGDTVLLDVAVEAGQIEGRRVVTRQLASSRSQKYASAARCSGPSKSGSQWLT
jgi:hypothetical protein